MFMNDPKNTSVSSVLVDYVVEVPGGAKPGSCFGYYDIDNNELSEFKSLKTEEIKEYLYKY